MMLSNVPSDKILPETFCLKVMHLPDDCTVQELNAIFRPFSDVVSVEVKHASISLAGNAVQTKEKDERRVSYGLVQFTEASAAAMAMKQLDGTFVRFNKIE